MEQLSYYTIVPVDVTNLVPSLNKNTPFTVQPAIIKNVALRANSTSVTLTWVKEKPWNRVRFRIRYISSWEDPGNPRHWKVGRFCYNGTQRRRKINF